MITKTERGFRQYRALHSQVLAVLCANEDIKDWTVYVGPVPGQFHDAEMEGVAREGNKQSEALSRALFPGLTKWLDENGYQYRP